MKKTIIVLMVLCFLLSLESVGAVVSSANGQRNIVYVENNITTDTVWKGNADYYICKTENSEPKIKNGATLTIEEGAVVYFADSMVEGTNQPFKNTDKYPYRYMSIESGQIIADGVKFTVVPDRQEYGWDGIMIHASDTSPSSGVFTNCIFEYGGGTGYMVGTGERATYEGGQTINLTVSECVFQHPYSDQSSVSSGIVYDNGYHRDGKGTVIIEKTTFNGCGRGVQILRSDTGKEIDIYIDQCTFNDSTIRSVEIMDGRMASVTNCIFNNNNPTDHSILLYYGYNDSNHPDEVVLSGNQFNGSASSYPMAAHAASKINKDADYSNSFCDDFPDEYKYLMIFGNVGRPSWANQNEYAVWGNVGVPYILPNSVSINYCQDEPTSYSELTIKPGVTVLLGEDVKLTSQGKLVAEGTEKLPISIRPVPGLENAACIEASRYGQVVFKHCVIENFWRGLWIDYNREDNINDVLVSIENCRISNTQAAAIHIEENKTPNGHIIIKNSEFGSASDGDNGIVIHQSKNVSITNCLVYGYVANGIVFHLDRQYMELYPEALTVENCTIAKNGFSGVKLEIYPNLQTLPENGVVISNSIVAENGVLNIAEDDFYQHERLPHPVSISYSLIGEDSVTFTNGIYSHEDSSDYLQIPSEKFSNCIWGDPMFADSENFDFHLKSEGGRWNGSEWVADSVTSPSIDAGNPESEYGFELSPNGDRINMGYYGNTPFASKSGAASTFELEKGSAAVIDGDYILGLTDNMTVDKIKSQFKGNAVVNGVGTGATVTIGEVTKIIIISGDIDGDGEIKAKDYLLVKRALMGSYALNEHEYKAAMVADGENLKPADYILIKRHILDTYSLF